MSSKKIDEQLIEFLGAHPEYFEGSKDQHVIRADLRTSIESYAKAIDPDAYESLRHKVMQYHSHAEERLKRKIASLLEKKDAEAAQLEEIITEYKYYEEKLSQMDSKIQSYESNRQAYESEGSDGSMDDYKFLAVGILGICFLYLGFMITEEVEITFVILGCVCFLVASLFQKKCKKRIAIEASPMSELSQRLNERSERLHEVWRVRKFSLLERKKASLLKIHEFEKEVQSILNTVDGIHQKK